MAQADITDEIFDLLVEKAMIADLRCSAIARLLGWRLDACFVT